MNLVEVKKWPAFKFFASLISLASSWLNKGSDEFCMAAKTKDSSRAVNMVASVPEKSSMKLIANNSGEIESS